MKVMAMVLTAFLLRVRPVSTMANPTCMNITRKALSRTHSRFTDWVKDDGIQFPSGSLHERRACVGGMARLRWHSEGLGARSTDARPSWIHHLAVGLGPA